MRYQRQLIRFLLAFAVILLLGSAYQTATNERLAARYACIRDYGPLIIHSGSKITLEAGGIYQYSNVLIHKGGVLEIKGKYPEWTTIRTSGDLRVEGTIKVIASTLVPDLRNIKIDSLIMIEGGKRSSFSVKGKYPNITTLDTLKSSPVYCCIADSLNTGDLKKINEKAEFRIKVKIEDTTFLFKDRLDFPVELLSVDPGSDRLTVLAKPFRSYNSFKDVNDTTSMQAKARAKLEYVYAPYQTGGQGGFGGRPTECKRGSRLAIDVFDGEKGERGRGASGHVGMAELARSICESPRGGCYTNVHGKTKSCIDRKNCLESTGNCLDDQKITPGMISSVEMRPGKGGMGGSVGEHGGLLFIDVAGDLLGEYGTIDVSGSKGKSGKAGESGKYTGGGGGGGGPGGNGGKVVFRVYGALDAPTIKTDGGPGGDGGNGGIPHAKDGLPTMKGGKGKKGSKGSGGAKDLGEYVVTANNYNAFYFTFSLQKIFGVDNEECESIKSANTTTVKYD